MMKFLFRQEGYVNMNEYLDFSKNFPFQREGSLLDGISYFGKKLCMKWSMWFNDFRFGERVLFYKISCFGRNVRNENFCFGRKYMHHNIHRFSAETENLIHISPAEIGSFQRKNYLAKTRSFPHYIHNFHVETRSFHSKTISPKQELFLNTIITQRPDMINS